MRFGRMVALFVPAVALAGCRKPVEAPKTDPPEAVFEKLRAAYLAGDGRGIWSMFSRQARLKQEEALAGLKSLPDAKLKEILDANHIELTLEAMRAMGPEEFATVTSRAKMKDELVSSRYRRLESPRVWKDGERLRLEAVSPDGKFTWTVWLVEESMSWKVDEEKDEENETVKIGTDHPK